MSQALIVRSLVSAARGDAAGAAAAAIGQLATMFAKNGGASNALNAAADGIREGRKSIAAGTLAGVVLSSISAILATPHEAFPVARDSKQSHKARDDAAAAYGEECAAALLAAVQVAKDARKLKREEKAGAADAAGAAAPAAAAAGAADAGGAPAADAAAVGIDAALIRCAAFSAESLADAIGANAAARERLSAALAILAGRDAAAAAAPAAAAAAAAAAAVSAAAAAAAAPAAAGAPAAAAAAAPAAAPAKGRRIPKAEKLAA